MSIEIKQVHKLSQQLVMTPQLQQAIKLLQLSRMELVDLVREEMMENPILEDGVDSAQELGKDDPERKEDQEPRRPLAGLVLPLKKVHRHDASLSGGPPAPRVSTNSSGTTAGTQGAEIRWRVRADHLNETFGASRSVGAVSRSAASVKPEMLATITVGKTWRWLLNAVTASL